MIICVILFQVHIISVMLLTWCRCILAACSSETLCIIKGEGWGISRSSLISGQPFRLFWCYMGILRQLCIIPRWNGTKYRHFISDHLLSLYLSFLWREILNFLHFQYTRNIHIEKIHIIIYFSIWVQFFVTGIKNFITFIFQIYWVFKQLTFIL